MLQQSSLSTSVLLASADSRTFLNLQTGPSFLLPQVLFRSFILRRGYETSYTCLARRAAKTNNVWNRLVRKGSIMRRCAMYGALQLAFTVICCFLFLATYFYFPLAVLLQVSVAAGDCCSHGNTG
jgi:hypothetical protein